MGDNVRREPARQHSWTRCGAKRSGGVSFGIRRGCSVISSFSFPQSGVNYSQDEPLQRSTRNCLVGTSLPIASHGMLDNSMLFRKAECAGEAGKPLTSFCPSSCAVCRSLIARPSIYDRPLGFFDYRQLIHGSAVDVARNIDDDGHWLIDSSITPVTTAAFLPTKSTRAGCTAISVFHNDTLEVFKHTIAIAHKDGRKHADVALFFTRIKD